jgi:hypothetical protein
LESAHPLIPHPPPETLHERQAIGRIAALIWAAIASFGALATIGPMRFAEMDLSETRLVVFSAAVIAGVTFVLPWPRLPRVFLNVLLIGMAGYITALAHACGAVHDASTMTATFAAALAVCLLPIRTGVAQVALIAVLLAGGLYLLGTQEADIQALRTSLLLSGLVVLCGLVLVLRSTIAAREAAIGHRLFGEDHLDAGATRKRIERELTAAARTGAPLLVVLIEVGLPRDGEVGEHDLAAELGAVILECIGLTDSAGRLGGLLFTVIAPGRSAANAGELAHELEHAITERLMALGHGRERFDVMTGWADNTSGATTAAELLESAREHLQAIPLAIAS